MGELSVAAEAVLAEIDNESCSYREPKVKKVENAKFKEEEEAVS